MSGDKTDVLIADDHQIMLEGLAHLIQGKDEFNLIAKCRDGLQAVEMTKLHKPDVVVMDIGMPNLNGMAATHLITTEVAGTHVVALSMHSEIHYIKNMLDSGAHAYLQKNSAFHELIEAIRSVEQGAYYFSGQICQKIAQNFIRQLDEAEPDIKVIQDETEIKILARLAEGEILQKIAREMDLALEDCQKYLEIIIKKWRELN